MIVTPSFVPLGKYLCEVRAGPILAVEDLKSFDEFLEQRFPESRSKGILPDVHSRATAATGEEGPAAGWGNKRDLSLPSWRANRASASKVQPGCIAVAEG